MENHKESYPAIFEEAKKQFSIKQYSKAIELLNNYLEVNPKDTVCIHYLGHACMLNGNYHDALKYYDDYIKINPDMPSIYFFKGNALTMIASENNYEEESKLRNAIEQYDKCLSLNPIEEIRYYAFDKKGFLYFRLGEFEQAAKCFIKNKTDILSIIPKFAINPNENLIQENVEPANEVIEFMLKLDADNYYYFNTIIEKNDNKRKKYISIYLCILKIISQLFIYNKYETCVAHYTQIETAKKLLFDKSNLRITSIATANDKHEGETLLYYLGLNEQNSKNTNQAFITSFTFNQESLNQFRLYGKEKEMEATGLSLVLNEDFFDVENKFASIINSDNDMNITFPPLKNRFRCIYIDPKTKKVISIGQKDEDMFYRESKDNTENKYEEYSIYISNKLRDIKKDVDELSKTINHLKLEKTTICELLLELKYLVKHSAFKEEQECRILSVENLKNNTNIKQVDGYTGMYIEYLPIDSKHLKQIYYGPKAIGVKLFKDMCKLKGLDVEVQQCDHPFF